MLAEGAEMIYRDISDMKYMLLDVVPLQTDILGYEAFWDQIHLFPDGNLVVRWYYCWDGASGPTVDSDCTLKAALGHDALYHLIRLGKLPLSVKPLADHFLYTQLQRDGMNPVRALIWYRMVEAFGWSSCRPGTQDDKIREVA